MENIQCEACGSKRCAAILYGRMVETPQLRQDLDAGKVVLGGCLVHDGMPLWRCLDCGQEWGQWQSAGINAPHDLKKMKRTILG